MISELGTDQSTLGSFQVGSDDGDLIFVTWIRRPDQTDNEVTEIFERDEAGRVTTIQFGGSALLPRAAVKAMLQAGHLLISPFDLTAL